MSLIKAVNNLDKSSLYTSLASSLASGGTALNVYNVNAFQASWGIQVGKTGEETAEVLMLGASAPSGTTLNTTGTVKYAHPTDTPVYAIKFDQLVFKRSTSGTAGTATEMTNGTVTITPDSEYTQFDDTSAASTYAYKVYYKNSVSGAVSDDSDWITPSGYSFYSLAKLRSRIKSKLFSSNYIKSDSDIDDWINEWMEQMNNVAIDVTQDYSIGTVDVAFGTSGLGTITATDFKEVRRFEVTYDSSNYYLASKMGLNSFEPAETFNSTHPYYYWQGDTVFGVKPSDTAGTARLKYHKLPTVLVNDTDELPTSMKGYTNTFVDYALGQAYVLDDKVDVGSAFIKRAEAGKEQFRSEITPRSKTGPHYITLTDPVESESLIEFI